MISVNNIRTELMLTSIIGLALPILILTVVSNLTTETYSNYESMEKLNFSKNSLKGTMSTENNDLNSLLEYVSENENFINYIVKNDIDSLNTESNNLKKVSNVENIVFLDNSRNVLTDLDSKGNPDFKNLNSGSNLIYDDNSKQFTSVYLTNIYNNGEIIGSVVSIDTFGTDEFVNHLKTVSNFDVSLYIDGKVVSTTLTDENKLSYISEFFKNSEYESNYELFLNSGNDYLTLEDSNGNFLGYIVISTPKSTALAYLYSARSDNLIVAFFGFVVSIVVSLFSSNSITKPITKLKEGAEEFSKGIYDHKIDVKTDDELEDLAESFNKMANSILTLNDLIDTDRKTMAKTLHELSDFMYEMSNGNLSVRLDENKEKNRLQKNVNQAINNFAQLLKSVKSEVLILDQQTLNLNKELKTTMDISIGVKEVADHVVSSTNEQCTKLKEISEDIDSTVNLVKNVNSAVLNTDIASKEINENSEEGVKKVENAIDTMQKITKVIDELGRSIQELGEESKKINEVTTLIKDIAEQTGLLALNASIEAARAGEAGKGFAVVASEIKSLAEEIKRSVDDINKTVQGVQVRISNTIKLEENGKNAVNSGFYAINEVNDAFLNIRGSVSNTSTKIEEIKRNVQDVSENTANVLKNVQEIALISEELASTAEKLEVSAEEQNGAVGEINNVSEVISKVSRSISGRIMQFRI